MTTIALVHPEHGTHFVYDNEEVARHKKLGWEVRPPDWKEKHKAEVKAKQLAAMKAEQERLAAEVAELESGEPKKVGRPRKVEA